MSDIKICALPGCDQRIHPLAVYTIRDKPGQYHSRACVDAAVVLASGKKVKVPQVPAKEFGAAGVTRQRCDRCNALCAPPLMCWPSSITRGMYCSNNCKKLSEQEFITGESTMTEATATETAADPKPIVAGKTAKKAVAKKAVAKKAVAKKAVAKKAVAVKTPKTSADNEVVRPGSNMEIIYKLVSKGATLDKMVEATGWEKEMTARTLNNLRVKGIAIERDEAGKYTLA